MALFQRLFWGSLLVALLVGSAQTAVHQWLAVPIILAAETFEDQKAEPAVMPAAVAPVAAQHADHEHGAALDAAQPWSPADGLERTFWTWVANVLHALSMALLVFAAMGLWVWRRGAGASPLRLAALVAAAGWLSLHQWPALGLPAEIPGMDAARLGSRQAWWALAALCAAAACAGVACLRPLWRWALAAALLALPFVWGAPDIVTDPLAGFSGEARQQLQALDARFVQVTAWIAVTLWASLALVCGPVFGRWIQPALLAGAAPQPSAADAASAT